MKKKLLSIILIILSMVLLCACQSNKVSKGGLIIEGETQLELGFEYEYIAKLNGKELENNEVYWMVSNDNVSLVNNKITPINQGKAKLTAILKDDGSKYCVIEIEVIEALVESIELYSSTNELKVGSQILINYRTVPIDVTEEVIWTTSDETIATVDSGIVTGVGAGTVTINAQCGSAKDSFTITVTKEITDIELYNDLDIKLNSSTYLSFNIDDAVVSTKSSKIVLVNNYMYAKEKGEATIEVVSKSNSKLKNSFTFNIKDGVNGLNITEEEQLQIDSLMKDMTTEQKVGQLFMLNAAINNIQMDDQGLYYQGRWGDNTKYYLGDVLSGRSIGNLFLSAQNTFISGGYEGNRVENLKNLVLGYQTYVLEQCGVGAMVFADASDTYYSSFLSSLFSSYLSNVELGTINDYEATITQAEIMSEEISKLGVNMLIYNAYTESTTTKGMFSKLLEKQSLNSKIIQTNLENNNVSLVPYYGTFMDNYTDSNSLSLNNSEIQSAINSGITAIDIYNNSNYSSTYSQTIPSYLKSIGYEGLIIDSNTQYMDERENYLTLYYDAIMSGIDMLYMQLSNNSWNGKNARSLEAYDYVVTCAENGTLPMERLNEAVTKVLLQKIRNGSISATFPSDTFGNNGDNQSTIDSLVSDNNTYYIDGEFSGLDKSKNTFVISYPYVEYSYNTKSDQYNFCATMLLNASKNGYSSVSICNFDSTYKEKLEKLSEGDQVIIAMYDDFYLYYTYTDENNEEQTAETSWLEILEIVKEKTDNIVLVFMNDPQLSNNFSDYNYTKIYANYNYDYDFTSLISVLDNGVTKGCKLTEK